MKSRLISLGLICAVLWTLPTAANDGWQVEVDNGFGSAARARAESLAVFDGNLWAGFLDPSDGCDIWVRVVDPLFLVWFPVVSDGFGDINAHHPSSMAEFTYLLAPSVEISRLYVGVAVAGAGAEIWAYDNSSPWVQIADAGITNADNFDISALEVFSGFLYAGTANNSSGAEIHHFTGISWAPADMVGGFGDAGNSVISDFAVHNGKLWAATRHINGGEVYWSSDGSNWTRAHADGAFPGYIETLCAYRGALYAGTSTSVSSNRRAQVWRIDPGPIVQVNTDGFGDAMNTYVSVLVEHGGALFAGTRNDAGTQVWRTHGGGWTQVASTGFGNAENFEADAMVSAGKDLVVGTWKASAGAELWRYTGIFGDGFESGDQFAWSTSIP